MNRIKENRRKMGLTQVQLAKLLNVAQGTLSSYENGRFEPDLETMRKMADFFNMSLDELFGIKEDEIDSQKKEISDIEFALSGEIRDLSEAEMQDVLDYVRFKRAQRAKSKE